MLKLPPHFYIDRATGQKKREQVYGDRAIAAIYKGPKWLAKIFSKHPFSRFYGWLQKRPGSAKKVKPFIEKYCVNAGEFEKKRFDSFNDFFVRKLKPEARPIAKTDAVLPADGRYFVAPKLDEDFYVKGQRFSAEEFVGEKGPFTAVLARLCPTDCHRFTFPCDGVPGETRLINGPLFSVNPFVLEQCLSVLWENKRFVTPFASDQFGDLLIVEVGATAVGSVVQTYSPGKKVRKGEEKGYFEFGGSAVVLLFKEGSIQLEDDLLQNSMNFTETKCHLGTPLGEILSDR